MPSLLRSRLCLVALVLSSGLAAGFLLPGGPRILQPQQQQPQQGPRHCYSVAKDQTDAGPAGGSGGACPSPSSSPSGSREAGAGTGGSPTPGTTNLKDLLADARAREEAERIMKQMEEGAQREAADAAAGGPKYQPSVEPDDPIVRALMKVVGVGTVEKFELLDSRWNGNEVFRYSTDKGPFFIKLNRVEDPSVFLTEAVGLSAIAATNTITCPRPLHLGRLPKVGDIGPGAFMVLEHLPLMPFGIMRSDMQKRLGEQLAALHLSDAHAALHQGRFGFAVSNFLALTPLNNTWEASWPRFFARRLEAQVTALYEEKQYGRAALSPGDTELRDLGMRVVQAVPGLLAGAQVTPSLIHGDLWVGNAGATEAHGPVIFDPACFFGHHEMELAMMTLFGGFRDDFWDAYHARIPRAPGFAGRQNLYQLYYYLNQLNLFGDAGVKATCLRLANELLLA